MKFIGDEKWFALYFQFSIFQNIKSDALRCKCWSPVAFADTRNAQKLSKYRKSFVLYTTLEEWDNFLLYCDKSLASILELIIYKPNTNFLLK